ncbi:MAG: hypothetical protein FJ033_00305 [Chloroflexi bacterium]|nr:hypothetical protein [Chloroflexota bacterium]
MARPIRIGAGSVSAVASLNECSTATAIWGNLPIRARASTWGDEIYFGIPVNHAEDGAVETVSLGDLGYWPPGHAFCIFFGPTPASRGDEIRPASPVNVVGRLEGDPSVFRSVPSGAQVSIERA